jgi:membrane peptidoglycan carboxypeptidase
MVLNPKHNQDVGAYGGRGAAPIWHDAMEPILAGQPDVAFPPAGIPLENPNPPPPPPRERPAPAPRQDEPPPDVPPDVPPPDVPPPNEVPSPPSQPSQPFNPFNPFGAGN